MRRRRVQERNRNSNLILIPSSFSSSGQKQDSTGSQKLCYRCSKNYSKGHEKVCKALNAKCNACGVEGHFEIACKKSGNFPKKSSSKFQKPGSTGRMNIASAVEEPALQADFFDEKGILKEYKPKSMYVLSGTSDDKPIMIEFGCGLTPLSFDRKLTLQADTGADMNAINKKTFNELFPDVELEESTHILQNFDKRLIKPIGSFRCFLRWKGHKYRVKFEVMGIETPNLLSRETTFLMGILKKCLSVEKTQNEPNNQISSLSVFRSFSSAHGSSSSSAQRKQIHLHPRKEYLAIQFRPRKQIHLCPRKVYLAIQFRPRKQLHLRPRKRDLK